MDLAVFSSTLKAEAQTAGRAVRIEKRQFKIQMLVL